MSHNILKHLNEFSTDAIESALDRVNSLIDQGYAYVSLRSDGDDDFIEVYYMTEDECHDYYNSGGTWDYVDIEVAGEALLFALS